MFTLRRRRNVATRATPSYLLFGREIKRPGEFEIHPANLPDTTSDPVAPREEQARLHQQQYRQRYAGPLTPPRYQVGDIVYATNHKLSNAAERYNANLALARTGPYTVIEVTSPEVFWIQKEDGPHKVYHSQLVRAPPVSQKRDQEHPDGVQR